MARSSLLGLFLVVSAFACEPAVDTPANNVCFNKSVLPLIARDCAFCHYHGEYGVKLRGKPGDYQEMLRYCVPYDSSGSPFLQWASGKFMHPVLWPKAGAEYTAVASWIDSGMKRDCFDMTFFGDCRFNSDCFPVSCLCPDHSMVTGQLCYVDVSSHKGLCARSDNCTNPEFGMCKGDEPDGGVDDGFDAGDGGDSGDGGTDDGGVDDGSDGYDAGHDESSDEGPRVSFSANIVPMLGSDCQRCHFAGQYGIKLTGMVSDYSEVMRYVDVNNPEGYGSFLWWAAGGARHPVSWQKGGPRYNLFLTWVQQGAQNN